METCVHRVNCRKPFIIITRLYKEGISDFEMGNISYQMNRILPFIILIVIVPLLSSHADEPAEALRVWKSIGAYFSPPVEYASQFGNFRSPREFYDGRPVKTPEDWQRRRTEILQRWQAMMGQWPKMPVLATLFQHLFLNSIL